LHHNKQRKRVKDPISGGSPHTAAWESYASPEEESTKKGRKRGKRRASKVDAQGKKDGLVGGRSITSVRKKKKIRKEERIHGLMEKKGNRVRIAYRDFIRGGVLGNSWRSQKGGRSKGGEKT